MNTYVVEVEKLRHNVRVIKRKAGTDAVYAVLKGNAYGLGLEETARLLVSEGLTRFAVCEPEDAAALCDCCQPDEILMLRPLTDKNEIDALIDLPVTFSIGSKESLTALTGAAKARDERPNVHVQIDTGLCRYGFRPDETDAILDVYKAEAVNVAGVYTHYHSACNSRRNTAKQHEQFAGVVNAIKAAGLEPGVIHTASSSALFKYGNPNREGVRVGSALLGRLALRSNTGLGRVGWAEAPIAEIRMVKRGGTIGYGAAYRATRDMRVAVLPVGYYNGFGAVKRWDVFRLRDTARRALSLAASTFTRHGKLYVEISGKRANVLGSVGMNHTVVDVTGMDCKPGMLAHMDISPLFAKGLDIEFR